jgi:MoaA/NifB/PqqE/SkfB family radical SAM enzyme
MAGNEPGAIAFEASIFETLRIGLRITRRDPRFVVRAIRLLWRQCKAARVRARYEAQGTHVPPFVIFSVTERCNFHCAGCYANILHKQPCRRELTDDEVRRILFEARDAGVSLILVAGGEPLLRKALLRLTGSVPGILFLLFTNGSLLDRSQVAELRSQPHVVPVVSLEGSERQTDARRGAGTHASVSRAMDQLRRARVFYGTSTTLTKENFDVATDEAHVRSLTRRGCRLFYYINYVPVEPGTESLQLDPEQVLELERRLERYRATLPAIFIAFPHDEVALGGCLAAGRGFLHINPYGDVEPCPFSPYSDSNLREVSLEEAFASPLFRAILTSGVELDETDGRCALWKRRDWVAGLVAEGTETGSERSSRGSPDGGRLPDGESLVRGE